MDADQKWYFSKEQLANTPSRKYGYDADRELSCRQQAANFIQDMGQRLQVTQLCINTAIVYMHRFYVFHSFTHFHRNAIAAAALFLAAKVEEQPRKLEHVIKVAQMCLHRDTPQLDVKSEQYIEQAQDLVMNENVLLQTLGFDVAIDHPHTHVVRCCHLVKASKDLAQTSYFMASNSLHLTTMCLQYKPTVVACFCIHLACKWSSLEIPLSNESKQWFWYVDKSVTQEMLEQLTEEFLRIFDRCPSRLKRKISSNNIPPGYSLGAVVNEQRRVGQNGGDTQLVSFQQPIPRNRNPNEDSRKKPTSEIVQIQNNNRTANLGISDMKRQQYPLHSRELDYARVFHPMPGTTQAVNSQQNTSVQLLCPQPGPSTSYAVPGQSSSFAVPGQNSTFSVPASSSSFSTPGPSTSNGAGPRSLPMHKHMTRPEAVFGPPKRSSQVSATVTSRQVKNDMTSTIPSTAKGSGHHLPRSGTSYPPENAMQQTNKTDNVQMKYTFPVDKHSSNHQKNHQKMFVGNQAAGSGWGNATDLSTRNSVNEAKYNKTETKSGKLTPPTSSYHMQINQTISITSSIVRQSVSPSLPVPPPPPPLPPSLLPPPPPPPPPPAPPTSAPPPITKTPSIFSPDKMTPPLISSPPKEMKTTILSPLLLSPIKSGRNRTSSSSSEPELIPVMPKVEDMLGFESLAKGKTAIKLPGKVNEQISLKEKKKDVAVVPINKDLKLTEINQSGQNSRPVEIVESKTIIEAQSVEVSTEMSFSSKHKKKKKHKDHREHKEKDKDKDREKKKDKHKDKHREKEKDKHRTDPAPIKITIPKDKLNIIPDKFQPSLSTPEPSAGLKIKIPKDKLMNPHVEQTKTPSSLRIKICKDAISSHSASKIPSTSGTHKKRERNAYKDDDDKYGHVSKHAKLSKNIGEYH